MTDFLEKPESSPGNLSEADRAMLTKFFASPADFPPAFKAWLADWFYQEVVPGIFARQIKGRTSGSAPRESAYITIDHDNPLTGERVLVAGTGITLQDGGANGSLVVSAHPIFLPGDAPEDAEIPVGV